MKKKAPKVLSLKNLLKDVKDPDLKSYGKKAPVINRLAMKVSIASRKRKRSSW